MVRRGVGTASASLLCLLALVGSASAEGQVYDHASDGRMTRMWVPEGLRSIRGTLIYGNPAGGDARGYIENNALRGFALQYDFVVIGTASFGYLQGDEIEIWEAHLAALAAASGHAELVHAPWAPLGFSNGGQMSYGFNALRPEKVIGFITNKGGYYNDPLPVEAALATPGILVAGEEDTEYRRTVIRTLFEENRARGALWAWVEEQGMGHEGDDERLFLPFLAEAVRLRYPEDTAPTDSSGVTLLDLVEEEGWLVDQTTWNENLTTIAPYDEYEGDPAVAGWVPSRGVAYLYRAFATRTDWLIKGGGGQILDRPLYIERPEWGEYWWQLPGEATELQNVRIDTSEYPYWTRVEFFSNGDLLASVEGNGTGQNSVSADLLLGGGVHGLSALVTDLDQTVRTTGLRHRAVVGEPLDPSSATDVAAPGCRLQLAGPNPAAAKIRLSYTIERDAFVVVSIFDPRGRRVMLLREGSKPAGTHRLDWSPEASPAGVYFGRLDTGGMTRTVRFVLLH
jgi:hypothetical protein